MRMNDRTGRTVISYAAPEDSVPKQAMIRLVERLSARQRIARAYEEARRALRPGDDIWAVALQSLDITVRHDAAKLAAVPGKGLWWWSPTILSAWSTVCPSVISSRRRSASTFCRSPGRARR
jgi:hypothetical protein